MAKYVLAIDQGTTSSRAIIFDKAGSIISTGQLEHEQIMPQAGWVEHNPKEIWDNTREAIGQALSKANITRHDIEAVGITNQRETAVVWDKNTGVPVYNAIVWQDTRTQAIVDRLAADGGVERFKQKVGLPLATYFSGTKIVWILENVEGARAKADAGELLFGTTDSWILWNLTGGTEGGVHATDVTNASRTMFMDLETLQWDDEILAIFDVPKSMLPEIKSSSEVYGIASGHSLLREVPIAGILGDQQAATFGQAAAVTVPSETDDHEDQHEGADDLGDEVPPVGADGRAGGEDAELVGGFRLLVEVLLVGEPDHDGTENGTDHLGADVGHDRDDVDGNAGPEGVGPARDQTEGDGRVQVGTRVVGGNHTGVDREAPADGDHEKAAPETLVLGERDVGDHAATEEHEDGRSHDL